jgi:hypothetical protein
MVGHLFGFSFYGHRVRLFRVDSFSFSSSKAADLDNEEHIPDIVKMVALCLGPIDEIMPTWQPNKVDLAGLDPRMTDWTEVQLRYLDGRHDLCGRRTTVWTVKFPDLATLVKASWLPPDMLDYEYEVLQHLAKSQDTDDEEVKGACRLDLLEKIPDWQEILGRLPSPIGLKRGHELKNFPGVTNRVPPHPDGDQLDHLELAI